MQEKDSLARAYTQNTAILENFILFDIFLYRKHLYFFVSKTISRFKMFNSTPSLDKTLQGVYTQLILRLHAPCPTLQRQRERTQKSIKHRVEDMRGLVEREETY